MKVIFFNQKFGDVVYFKYSNETFVSTSHSKNMLPFQWPGYMCGDGLSTDGLSCAHIRTVGEATVTRFLFQIEPARKYLNSNETRHVAPLTPDKQLEERLRDAENEEKQYQETLKQSFGTPIYYGQNFFLRHLFSGDTVTVHPQKLARQVGSIKVGLAEASEFSALCALPSSRIKKAGDLVNYSDAIVISSAKEDHYFLHVSESLAPSDRGLEINGSETRTEWKPRLYSSDQRDTSLFAKTTVVTPGAVLSVFNRHIGGYLSASSENLSYISTQRDMITTGGQSLQLLRPIPMAFTYMHSLSTVRSHIIVEISPTPSFYSLWEIQRVQLFEYDPVLYYKETDIAASAVRLKNIATQEYLCTDFQDDTLLTLNVSGHLDQCIFFFESKSGITDSTVVSTEDLLRIRNYRGKCISALKTVAASNNKQRQFDKQDSQKQSWLAPAENTNHFQFCLSDKVDSNSSTFELMSKPREVVRIANQLSSIFFNLGAFYCYLQDWGLDFYVPVDTSIKKSGRQARHSRVLHFDYKEAFETEKKLEIEVKELFKNLEMIYQYLSSEVSVQGNLSKYSELRSVKSALLEEQFISYDMRKKLLIEQEIMDLLFRLAELIIFKSYESLETFRMEVIGEVVDKKSTNLITMHQLKDIPPETFEELPQPIAANRLKRSLMLIFKIMHLAVWDNEDCSNYLALRFNFFQKIIDFYPKEAMDVMREVARNITNQGEEYVKFYKPWIQMLEEISEKKGNIKKQIFLLNTLSGLILDESNNTPIEVLQTKIFADFFTKAGGKKTGFLKFALVSSSGAPEEDDSKYQVIFVSNNPSRLQLIADRSSNFKEQNPNLANCIAGNSHPATTQVYVKLLTLSKHDNELVDYVYYISAYIKLMTNLCKGRKEQHIIDVEYPCDIDNF